MKPNRIDKLFAGIDVGSLTAEAVLIEDHGIVGAACIPVLPNPLDSAARVLASALKNANRNGARPERIVATGYGRESIEASGMAHDNLSEISCHGYGAFCLSNDVRTIVDIGGQDAKVIRVNDRGELDDFAMNDKCAAGTGHFLELMSRALGVSLDQLGPLSMGSRKPILMTNRCSIYVETEVIHYLQKGEDSRDVAAGINRAMAERVFALVRRVGAKSEVMMTGGVAKNEAVRTQLEKMMGLRTLRPSIDPQWIGAYGAAMFARKEGVR